MNALPPSLPIRTECPPGACVCDRDALLQDPQADARVLLLTREEEKRLLQRLEQITSLADLRRLQDRMEQQLGIRLTIAPGPNKNRRPAKTGRRRNRVAQARTYRMGR